MASVDKIAVSPKSDTLGDGSPLEGVPNWQTGKPVEPGLYVGFSTLPGRLSREHPSLYTFDGKVFQHWTGWYDHGLTHWIKTDLPVDQAEAEGQS